ncbi:hypothetical protein FA15DRAFT_460480 [Coprinopsis marcescibilis]|uniref:Uncharacterized protein n=1 Tax=Coprinopsis marcescibilis TaxID=230819 RepID=A0A5C3L5P4_COPMA|nr:hypothetical protein FA15DRAFT_460480 [Coprinopsis marcescibilis]
MITAPCSTCHERATGHGPPFLTSFATSAASIPATIQQSLSPAKLYFARSSYADDRLVTGSLTLQLGDLTRTHQGNATSSVPYADQDAQSGALALSFATSGCSVQELSPRYNTPLRSASFHLPDLFYSWAPCFRDCRDVGACRSTTMFNAQHEVWRAPIKMAGAGTLSLVRHLWVFLDRRLPPAPTVADVFPAQPCSTRCPDWVRRCVCPLWTDRHLWLWLRFWFLRSPVLTEVF